MPRVNQNIMVNCNNDFCLNLYRSIKGIDGNIFFSPISIFSTLLIIYEGAKNNTAKEIQDVLNLPKDKDVVRQGQKNIKNILEKNKIGFELNSSNALWVQKNYPFFEEYKNIIENYYDARTHLLDFEKDIKAARIKINRWVEDKTEGKIRNLISEGVLSVFTRFILTNTIYFKSDWANQFMYEDTWEGQFKLNSGETVVSEMMHKTDYYNYRETSNCQCLEMNYLDNDLSMLIILPKKNNMDQFEDNLSTNLIHRFRNEMVMENVKIIFPKFKFETKLFLEEILQEMGVEKAFKWPGADFSGMSPTKELYIDKLIHQTFIEVGEEGTEAAAATALAMLAGCAPEEEEPKLFNADHPFIFIIQQKRTGNILFFGRLSNPSGENLY